MTETALTLRPAGSGDVDFVCRLIAATMRAHVEQTWGSFKARVVREHTRDLVAAGLYSIIECDGRAIGALGVRREPTHLQLEQLFILPSHQNRGFGTRLIRALVQEASRESKPVRLRVLAVNPARRLYEREGFVVTHRTAERIFMQRRA